MVTKCSFCVLSIIVLASVLLAACQPKPPPFECTDAIGCVDIAPGEPVKIGVLQALSGSVAKYGIKHLRAAEYAIALRDASILGHPIETQVEDELSTPAGGAIAALKLVADPQLVAVIGPTSSVAATTSTDIISEAGLVMITGGASSASLTSVGGEKGSEWQVGFFRTYPSSAQGAEISADFAFNELGLRKAAIINDGGAYSQSMRDAFNNTFAGLGGETVADITITPGDKDIRPAIQAVALSGAELLYLPLYPPEAEQILTQDEMGDLLDEIVLIGGSALVLDDFLQTIGDNALGMYFRIQASRTAPEISAVQADYMTKYGTDETEPIDPFTFDATNLLLDAISAVAVQEADGTLHIGRQALRDQLYATDNYAGITGQLSSDRFGDLGTGMFNIARFEDPSGGVEGLRSNVVFTYQPVDER